MMEKIAVFIIFAMSTTLSAKIDMSQFKDEVKLGDQTVSIVKAEVVINKMPTNGSDKDPRYIIIDFAANDKKKIGEEYTIVGVRFPSCIRRFNSVKVEKRGDSCVVRNLPSWAKKGILVVLSLKDSKGDIYKLKANATEITVH
ncbi:MAG: hypothetical protein NE328_22885 [Lentisphaeraceae bacterium]|nr:hypothetical protein [Lentisphaeraceae bacterium]